MENVQWRFKLTQVAACCLLAVCGAGGQEADRTPQPPPPGGAHGQCADAQARVTELDRQITRIAGQIDGIHTELAHIGSTAAEIAKAQTACIQACPAAFRNPGDDCPKGCDSRALSSTKAAEKKANTLKQACQNLQRSTAALAGIRADISSNCSVNPKDAPRSQGCQY